MIVQKLNHDSKAERSAPTSSSTRRAEKAARRKIEILRSAAGAFREHGAEGASMRKIADALGLSQGSLYYYFQNKHEILYFCQNTSLQRMIEFAEEIRRLDVSEDEKLRQLIRAQMDCMLDALYGASAHIEFHTLPDRLLEDIIGKRDRYERIVRGIIRQGIRSGVFAPVDPKLIAFAILGAVNWTARWYRPEGGKRPEQIAESYAAYFVRGLQAAPAVGESASSRGTDHRSKGSHGTRRRTKGHE